MSAGNSAKVGSLSGRVPRSHAGMFSRRMALHRLDNRTIEVRVLNRTVAELTAHVGGEPTPAQKLIIDASAILVMRLQCILGRYLAKEGDIETLDRYLVALQNALRLNMQSLGLEKPERAVPSLKEHLTAKAERVA
jgi:hypothetical protein